MIWRFPPCEDGSVSLRSLNRRLWKRVFCMLDRRGGYEYEDLLACGRGERFGPGNAQLPLPPMLMFDRISQINETGGEIGRGRWPPATPLTPSPAVFVCHPY